MMGKLYCFVEGKIYSSNEIPIQFIHNGYFAGVFEDQYMLKVCGVANFIDDDYIFLPKAYNIRKSEAELRHTGKSLFHALLKYKDSIRLSDEELDWLGEHNKNIQYLNIVRWLINDYTMNGLYMVNERIIESNGKGRIEWLRTIKSKQPYIDGNQFSYLELVTSKNNVHSDHIISQIHESIILQCIKEFGWLFGISDSGKTVEIEASKDQQIIVLNKKLKETYTAREIRLLQHLIAYLKKTTADNRDIVLVTPYFHTVWEEMLKRQLGHDETLNKLVPRPYWQFGESKSYTRQIPDILIRHEDGLFILDAKYYSIVKEYNSDTNELLAYGSFPGWESVVKQMYYNLSLKDKGFINIKNIFLFPQSLLANKEFSYVGYTGVEGQENIFGRVLAYAVDIDVVLDDYVSGRSRGEDLFIHIIETTNKKGSDYC